MTVSVVLQTRVGCTCGLEKLNHVAKLYSIADIQAFRLSQYPYLMQWLSHTMCIYSKNKISCYISSSTEILRISFVYRYVNSQMLYNSYLHFLNPIFKLCHESQYYFCFSLTTTFFKSS